MTRLRLALAIVGLLVMTEAVYIGTASALQGGISIGTQGTKFTNNGVPVNNGSRAEGLLINFRAIHAVVDDYNPKTRSLWSYPNGPWDANRNTNEFIAMLPTYAARGLNMVTVGLQGGHPRFKCNASYSTSPRNFSAFTFDGAFRADAKARLQRVIAAADQAGIIVTVQYFYQNQDGRLSGNAAVIKATQEATQFLRDLPNDNILVEVANEVTLTNYKHSALQPSGIHERIDQIHSIWPGALVSVSMSSGGNYPSAVAQRIDWSSMHANSITSTTELVGKINNLKKLGHPVVVTEDGWHGLPMEPAINAGAGWGLYVQGCEFENNYEGSARYRDGFQSPPINWAILDPYKRAFFERAGELTST
jgi:hypothetical protein